MRQIAWRLLPFLMFCYFVSFVDRVNVGFAALQMVKDLHMSPKVFGFGGVFFVSYFLFEVPSNLLLERVGARLWIARIMITWGFLAAGTAFVVGPRSFYAMRLLLGAAEAGFFPGIILYLTYWFPSEYRARIVGMFAVAIPVSSFLGSPISAALLGVDGRLGLRGWQWMFIMEGAPAILLGFFCLLLLSDKPAKAGWLDARQKAWLSEKLESESRRGTKRVGHMGLWKVLWNKYVLVLSVTLAGSTAVSSGLQIWQPQIIKSYGLTNMQTGLLNSIPFALASVIMVLWGRRSDQTGERVWHTAAPLFVTALSLASALVFNSLTAIILILCLAVIGIYAGKGPVWALSAEWLSTTTAAAGLAQMNAISNLAGFGTTYVVGSIKQATGSYPLAILPLACLSGVGALAMLLIARDRRETGIPVIEQTALGK
jgi:MFS transporter, ACS family, tartrate transporter